MADTLHQMGVRIPDDVALVGYDNWEVFSAQSRPPLTTIDTNLQEIGAAAAKYLFVCSAVRRSAASSGIRPGSWCGSRPDRSQGVNVMA